LIKTPQPPEGGGKGKQPKGRNVLLNVDYYRQSNNPPIASRFAGQALQGGEQGEAPTGRRAIG